jgi:hypothetical protein
LYFPNTSGNLTISVEFNLINKTFTINPSVFNINLKELTDGWFRVSASYVIPATLSLALFGPAALLQEFTVSTAGIYIWKPQLELGDVASDYRYPIGMEVVLCEQQWVGKGDVMSISGGGVNSIITANAESSMTDLVRGNTFSYTQADQDIVNPGDKFFSHVLEQIERPVVWPTKEFFRK